MRHILTIGLLLFVGLAGCQIIDGGSHVDDGFGEVIWVAQDFSGGQQCNPDATFDPPDTEADLKDAGVGVFETAIAHHAVCEACIICPAYSATHFAQIRESNLDRASRLGYEESDGPGDAG